MMSRAVRMVAASGLLFVAATAHGQTPTPPTPPPAPAQPEPRSTGLPKQVQWTFNFDAGWGTFGFANSLYNSPREPGVPTDLSDQWFEGYVKPALSASFVTASTSEIYGKLSVVGERTYGSVPAEFGEDVSSFGPEDMYIGWRSGQKRAAGDLALDVTVGRAQYRLGRGFLLYDGSAEGGSRGGYWTNARKAFEFAAIGRLKFSEQHTIEGFYLDKDELRESDSGTRLAGVNYELGVGEESTFGATYMEVAADALVRPERDGLNVFNLRAFTSPLPKAPDLSFEIEYARERNGQLLDSTAWTFQGGYELSGMTWSPTLAYRYASFQGDDPATAANEAFDPLLPGFYDWGQWWQGEIAGGYLLSNSNLKSHLFRADASPSEAISTGLLFFRFTLDQPASFAPGVTDKDLAFEVDWYMDWKLNRNFTTSFILAFADPGKAVQQAFNRTKNFVYGMAYLAYSF